MRLIYCASLFAMLFVLPACQTSRPDSGSKADALLVSVCPDYPPLVFKRDDRLLGIEVDFAMELGRALNRRVRFVELKWDEQIDALLQYRTDIIMSGMTITPARKIRIAFSEPYLELGIMPLVRSKDAKKYTSPESIFNGDARIGVQKDSTADALANRRCPSSNLIYYLDPSDAYFYLTNRRIDVFLYDGPAVIWLAAQHEADLEALRMPLTNDKIGWGMRKNDPELQASVNRILAQLKKDGTLQKILDKWLPPEHNQPTGQN